MADPSFDAARRMLARGPASPTEHEILDRLLARDPALRLRLVALSRAILLGAGAEISPAEFGARLHVHVESELDRSRARPPDDLVAAHLAAAPEARAEYDALRAALSALRDGALPEPPAYPTFDVSFALTPTAGAPAGATSGPLRALLARLAAAGGPRGEHADDGATAVPREPRRLRGQMDWREAALPALAVAAILILLLRGIPPPPPTAIERTATAAAAASGTPTATPLGDARPTALFGPPGDPRGGGQPLATPGSATATRTTAPTAVGTPSASATRPAASTSERPRGGGSISAPPPTVRPAPTATLAGYPGELPTRAPTDPVPTSPAEPTDLATSEPSPAPPATATEPADPPTP